MNRIILAAAAIAATLGLALASLSGASAQDKLKVGFIYVGPVGDMGWTYQHEVGRKNIADQFKDAVPVILNLQGTDTDLSKRLIDFASGLTYALDGGMQRIADKVFLLTPRNVEVSAEERARLMEKGFFNQS